MCSYYSTEWDTLPHVILTSDTEWDPSVLDSTKVEDDAWFDDVSDSSTLESHGTFNMHRNYFGRNIFQCTELYQFGATSHDEYFDFIL